jgi:hypothetical protein
MSFQDPNAPYSNTPPQPQEWLTPANQPYAPYDAPPPARPSAMYELRPLTLSEILDRTFSLYRSRFWLFAGIAAISGAVQALSAGVQMLVQSRIMLSAGRGAGKLSMATAIVGPILTVVTQILFLLAFTVTLAATVFAVSEVYLGRNTTVADSLKATVRKWYRWLGIAIWQGFSLLWLPMLLMIPGIVMVVMPNSALKVLGVVLIILGLPAFVVGYIFFLRNSLAVPASVVERLTIRPSMRRSKMLSPGAKGRIFVLGLITYALYMVVGVLQMPFALFIALAMAKHQSEPYVMQGIVLIIGFLGHSVVSPVAAIGITLFYFDQRVRKEAFDLTILMGEEFALEHGAPDSPLTAEQVAVPAYEAPASTPAYTAYPAAAEYAPAAGALSAPYIPPAQDAPSAPTEGGTEPPPPASDGSGGGPEGHTGGY